MGIAIFCPMGYDYGDVSLTEGMGMNKITKGKSFRTRLLQICILAALPAFPDGPGAVSRCDHPPGVPAGRLPVAGPGKRHRL